MHVIDIMDEYFLGLCAPTRNLKMFLIGNIHSYVATLVAFCVYEFGLGLYWPAIAILRANMVPDDIRYAWILGMQ